MKQAPSYRGILFLAGFSCQAEGVRQLKEFDCCKQAITLKTQSVRKDFSLVTVFIGPCESLRIAHPLKTFSTPNPEILITPPVAQDLVSFVGLVKVSINASANSKAAGSGLCPDESSEIPARFARAMLRRINRVVDANPSDCHFCLPSLATRPTRIAGLMQSLGWRFYVAPLSDDENRRFDSLTVVSAMAMFQQ